MFEINIYTVFIFALLTAIATGIGAVPFLFLKKISKKWLGHSNAAAAGLMIAASFSLIYEGIEYSLFSTVAGVLIGLIFIIVSENILSKHEGVDVSSLQGADARKFFLIMGVMTIHSFTEGIGVGVSFGGGQELGIFITLAIAIHNIPEGLAISLVAVPRGLSPWYAIWWSILSSIPQPLMAVPAYLFVETFAPFLPVGLGFAAGAMIWMVFAELIPEANEDSSPNSVGIIVTVSVALMIIFREYLH